ncbi:MAG: hypothetical protein RMJ60_08105, partial [Anaerolineales bacterium]|nr:hypothetical protein [Anaerolineales bacterium]
MLSVLRKATIALLLLLITFAFSLWLVDPVRSANSDFFTFWLAARLVLEGYNPYLTDIWVGGHHLYGATWIPNQTFIYPLPVALLFLPLGALPLYWAYLLWVWILEGLILLSLCHLLK